MKTSVVLAAALTAMNTANAAVIPFFDGELSINYDANSGWSFGFDKQPSQSGSGSAPATTNTGNTNGSATTTASTGDDGDDEEDSCGDSGSTPPANSGGSNGSSSGSGSGDYFSQWKQGLDDLIQKGKSWFSGLFG
ncbi:conserved hypothetical protein [Candida dubliniensis CD36]|uniref:Secreted protein n=1 Tax=Candida dubliniensis (strain CD36 / ATCC MYA-646 / CBS 7987 / NCPF 3949 / NRRL Y-17841) TaxID=573826 RepID=B9WN31_CANDC|nr:conserved hypothetical protein [Candida dubliniensis CD36]CAX40498.1 conserved hypothetical protein [Candida dubliniensis CD36]